MEHYSNTDDAQRNQRYSLWSIHEAEDATTYLVREHDDYGEFPNIFVKVYHQLDSTRPSGIILIDTGTGLDAAPFSGSQNMSNGVNIACLLESINPGHAAPYTVIISHCHYDHIRGIHALLEASKQVTVYSSSHDIKFITPYHKLQKHSLCEAMGLEAPRYDTRFLDDGQSVNFEALNSQDSVETRSSSLMIMHTPGHTPDSLSVYDRDYQALFIGDLFYEAESVVTRSGSRGQWQPEPPQPVIFTDESRIKDWSASMHKLLDLVREENEIFEKKHTNYRQDGQGTPSFISETRIEDWSHINAVPCGRVVLSAAHVSVNIDAEFAILDMLDFMLRIQLDQVAKRLILNPHGGHHLWLWEDPISRSKPSRFSVRSPWSVIYPSIAEPSPVERSTEQRQNSMFLRSMMRPALRKSSSSVFKASPLSQVAKDSVSAQPS